MTAPKQDRQSARRAIRALFILQGHVRNGLRLTQIAAALETSLPNALRDMEVLAEEGVVERIPGRNDCWHLTRKIVQLSTATKIEFVREQEILDEFNHRYLMEPL